MTYSELLKQLIDEIRSTRLVLANRITTTTNQLYWTIGQYISEKKLIEGHGKSVVEQLAIDLKAEFPDYGFTARYLWEMKRFYETYAQADAKLKQAVSVLPWGHNILLLQKAKDGDEAFFYASTAVEMGWSRKILLNFIKADAYQNRELLAKQHNFDRALPEHLQEQATETLKSRYNLAFLGVAQPMKELELEKRLIEKIRHFMLELGAGFSFVGNQYKLSLNAKDYFVDLLFFHRKLKALIAVELKIGEFKPEYVGKMGFYLSLLDRQARMSDENPSIGLILCADKDAMAVEIALQSAISPIAVADYQLYFPEEALKHVVTDELSSLNLSAEAETD